MFITEIKRVFSGSMFYVSVIITLILLFYGIYDYAFASGFFPISEEILALGNTDPHLFNTFDAVLWSRIRVLSLPAPLLAALPFAASLAIDRNSLFLNSLLPRTNRTRYIISKFCVNGLAGGLALALPHIIIYLIAYLIFPEGIITYEGQSRMNVTGSFTWLYESNPALYVWGVIGVTFLFGSAYASLGLLVSLISNNVYIILASPFLFYIIPSVAFTTIAGANYWLPTVTWSIHLINNPSWSIILAELIIIIVICATASILYSFTHLQNLYVE